MVASYGIEAVITTVTNPQANAIIERIHQVIANMLCTSNLITDAAATKFRNEEQLHATQWAINTTYHKTLKASPAQLVFGQDMKILTTYLVNWSAIQHCKQEVTNTANKQEKNITFLMNIMWDASYSSANKLIVWAKYRDPL